jgi:uncharacterized protein YoxC
VTFNFNINLNCPQMVRVFELLETVIMQGEAMSAALDRLTEEVNQTSTAVDSVLALVGGLADQIRALQDDPAKLAALADELDAKQAAIADAVAANTPQE